MRLPRPTAPATPQYQGHPDQYRR